MAKTIRDAIVEVLQHSSEPMAPPDILKVIQERGLYEFQAKDPLGIVRNQLRRHADGVERKAAPATKTFRIVDDGRFALVD